MTFQAIDYKTSKIRFITLPDNGLLLNTRDICSALGITDRPAGSDLSQPSLDLASAVIVAASLDSDFAMWLNESFTNYNSQQLVHPHCDELWSNSP
jgi:prophage antirepressor-like protein